MPHTHEKLGPIKLGLRENIGQFSLLVLINVFVGMMVGLERTVVPLIGEKEFGLVSKTAIVSFIVSFGVTKAVCNLFAARTSERIGRKKVLITGWLIGLPVPFIIIFANHWFWFDIANVLLGVNQALCWSMTMIMKVDLVGPKRRGFALGLNEFAGYLAVGFTAWITGYIASIYALRPQPFYLGIGVAFAGLLLSLFFAKETRHYATLEAKLHHASVAAVSVGENGPSTSHPSMREIFAQASWKDRNLFSCSQAGLVNNLNDGMSWGIGRRLELGNGIQFLECGGERVRQTPDRLRPEFLVRRLEVQVMHGSGKLFGSLKFALDESLVDDDRGSDVGEFTPLPRLYLPPHWLEVSFHSINTSFVPFDQHQDAVWTENDFECLASTGVNAAVTMFPNSGCPEFNSSNPSFDPQ